MAHSTPLLIVPVHCMPAVRAETIAASDLSRA
jgi:hypothetical protein